MSIKLCAQLANCGESANFSCNHLTAGLQHYRISLNAIIDCWFMLCLQVLENQEAIIIVMECAVGGELFQHLHRVKLLSESEARRLFRQTVSAIFYCHSVSTSIAVINKKYLTLEQISSSRGAACSPLIKNLQFSALVDVGYQNDTQKQQ